MKFGPRRVISAVAQSLFEIDDDARVQALTTEVLTFVAAAGAATRVTLWFALALLRWAPLILFLAPRPLDRLTRDRRREVLERIERSAFGLVLVPWRTLLMLHFFEDARELARIGYRNERRRHLAVIPVPASSGVRLRTESGDLEDQDAEEQGAA